MTADDVITMGKGTAGRSVLVTGAGEGFGTEVAFRLASDGFRVYAGIADKAQRPELEAAARRRKVQVRVLHANPAEAQTIDAALRAIVEECGSIYGVVNSELLVAQGFFEDWRDEEIRPVFETNLFGTMTVTRAVH